MVHQSEAHSLKLLDRMINFPALIFFFQCMVVFVVSKGKELLLELHERKLLNGFIDLCPEGLNLDSEFELPSILQGNQDLEHFVLGGVRNRFLDGIDIA